MRGLLASLLLTLLACAPSPEPPREGLSVSEALGGDPPAGFARAVEPRGFAFPADHGPHPAYATEWWYLTGNLRAASGRRFGYQFTLFRVGLSPDAPADDSSWRTNALFMGHLAISDIAAGEHHRSERLARAAAGLAGARTEPLRVWLGPWQLAGQGDPFPLSVTADAGDFALDLQLTGPRKPVVLQGERGLSRKSAAPGNASYYYSLTRIPSRGQLRIGERLFEVSGDSWLDREWSSSALGADQSGWDWFALQLDDGRELMFYRLRDKQGGMHPFSAGTLVEADGRYRRLGAGQVRLEPLRHWQSPDGRRYPVAWRLAVPDAGLDLQVEAAFDAQWMDLRVRYWEGAVTVSGSQKGVGYLELAGY